MSDPAVTKRKRSRKGSLSPPSSPNRSTAIQKYRPCHREQESFFSTSSGFTNYRGLLNDCILCLVFSNSQSVISNLQKYGLLIDPSLWLVGVLQLFSYSAMILISMLMVFSLLPLCIEKAAVKGLLTSRSVLLCYTITILTLILFPVFITFMYRPGAVGAFITMMTYTIVWMKILSYCQVNHWCRTIGQQVLEEGNEKKVYYPDNINFKDLMYFMFAPTLCYELNYPRIQKIRKMFLFRRTIESVFLFYVLIALTQQWLVPTIFSSVEPFQKMQFSNMIERILRLALPNHLIWLLGFYWFFHSFLNFTGEILRFGDRCFYKDWWNAESISQFWRQWNIPVHRWASRHVYNPIISLGYSKMIGQLAVFLLSAFFHEYLISIPLKMLRPWAFTAMLFQIPLVYLTSLEITKGQVGNVIVWVSIVLGQPVAILMYMHDYVLNQD